MSGTSEKARDIFLVGLRNPHAIENQTLELLERQVGRLENYPEMSQRMQQYIAETKEQTRRIEATTMCFVERTEAGVKAGV